VIGGEVRFDSYTRHLFSRHVSMYAIEPMGVVFPRDAAHVAAVVTTARDFGVPVLPRGRRDQPGRPDALGDVTHSNRMIGHGRRDRGPVRGPAR
jgi:hypothetical protein